MAVRDGMFLWPLSPMARLRAASGVRGEALHIILLRVNAIAKVLSDDSFYSFMA